MDDFVEIWTDAKEKQHNYYETYYGRIFWNEKEVDLIMPIYINLLEENELISDINTEQYHYLIKIVSFYSRDF